MTARADRPSHLGACGRGSPSASASSATARRTLGVAGLSAVEHFHARASIIATFVVLQLLVYAAMQIPAGVLLDRYGSRRMLTLGLATMGIGQIVMAFADSVTIAIPGRMILGAGDAFVFSSVIRLLPSWFPPRRVPIVTQFVGLSGQLGQIVSALPFAWLLDARGWRTAFLAVTLTALAAAALSWTFLRDRPPGIPAPVRPAVGMRANLRAAARHPGTLLGMWTHWTTCFAPMVFGMMWGFPYLTQGEGVSKPTASLLIGLLAVVGAIVGPMLGSWCSAIRCGAAISCSRWWPPGWCRGCWCCSGRARPRCGCSSRCAPGLPSGDRVRRSGSTSPAPSTPVIASAPPTRWSTSAGSPRASSRRS
ncbi:membrane hypothetical protein [Nostocoides australiense Ben110]|uniref:Major facilitator superfamily (MFS) profile domain-containing protein n=1 Tax=Nostocoides australiense Ben110 TaxID=1193182 RepID=W6JUA7_9MICO|nr:MFS transporter [Tetrasphaera australiensis]CCH72482.1 membrane hypothetical protein [Tetrasphaera australiensis Ben110]